MPATKSILGLAKVLRLPRNLHLTFRKCCACHAIQPLRKVDLAAVRLPRNPHPTSPKCCACHAIQASRNLCVAVPMGPAPTLLRPRSDQTLRTGQLSHLRRRRFAHRATLFAIFSHLRKCRFTHRATLFCDFLFPCHTRALFVSIYLSPYLSIYLSPYLSIYLPIYLCAAPATKSVLDLAKVLRLPRFWHLTLRKCCACREIYTWPCQSTAPATKSTPDISKVLRLPRNSILEKS